MQQKFDRDFHKAQEAMQRSFDQAKARGVIFNTGMGPSLWAAYKDAFLQMGGKPLMQYHDCGCCRQFIESYGAMVTLDHNGDTQAVMWPSDDIWNDVDQFNAYRAVFQRLREILSGVRVKVRTGATLPKGNLGLAVFGADPSGGKWEHWYAFNSREVRVVGDSRTTWPEMFRIFADQLKGVNLVRLDRVEELDTWCNSAQRCAEHTAECGGHHSDAFGMGAFACQQ